MATQAPLMPKATAVWLLDNTALTFEQVAEFCKLHPLEVKAIADGDAAQGIKGLDPVSTGQLSREEIATAEADPNHKLQISAAKVTVPGPERGKKGPRYTPVSRRQDRPNAILWLVRNHPELKDAAIMRLVGTTKSTIAAIRDRTHWNAATLTPMDPVTLGLCYADRSRFRGEPRQQGKAGAGRHRRDAAARRRDHGEEGSRSCGRCRDRSREEAGRLRSRRRRRVRQAQAARRQGRRGQGIGAQRRDCRNAARVGRNRWAATGRDENCALAKFHLLPNQNVILTLCARRDASFAPIAT